MQGRQQKVIRALSVDSNVTADQRLLQTIHSGENHNIIPLWRAGANAYYRSTEGVPLMAMAVQRNNSEAIEILMDLYTAETRTRFPTIHEVLEIVYLTEQAITYTVAIDTIEALNRARSRYFDEALRMARTARDKAFVAERCRYRQTDPRQVRAGTSLSGMHSF